MALRMASRLVAGLGSRILGLGTPSTAYTHVSSALSRVSLSCARGNASLTRASLPFARTYAGVRTYATAQPSKKASKGPQFLMPVTVGVAVITSGLSVVFFGGKFSDEEKKDPEVQRVADVADSQHPVLAYFTRAKTRISHFIDEQVHGPQKLLLPPMLPPQYRLSDYTLVLDLEDTLIHNEWSPDHGWRTRKRPGVDEFLQYAAMTLGFEIVVFSDKSALDGTVQIIDKLDPNQYILYRLYKGHQSNVDGEPVKDLGKLNRDLKKVIIVDDKKENFRLHPYNGIKIKKFDGDVNDRALLELLPFLQAIIEANVDDVRVVLERYKDIDDIPKAFNEAKSRIMAERKMQMEAQLQAQQQQSLAAQQQQQKSAKSSGWLSWLGL